MNGGVTDPQRLHWVNPRTGSYLMASADADYNGVAYSDSITCPGYRGTVVGGWQIWGVYVSLAEVKPPNMRTSFMRF